MKYVFFLILIAWFFGSIIGCKPKYTDRSLFIAEYEALGMPDCNKPWDANDYSKANEVLSRMKWEKPFSLPIKDSGKSGKLYNKLVSHDIMSFLKADSLALYEKAMQSMEVLNVFENWINVYINLGMQKQYYRRELLDLHLHTMSVRQEMINLADKIQVSDEPGALRMRQGIKSIRKMYVTGLVKTLELQSNASQFSINDLDIVTDSIAADILGNKSWMDSTEKSDLKYGMHVAMDSIDSDFTRSKYKDISFQLSL